MLRNQTFTSTEENEKPSIQHEHSLFKLKIQVRSIIELILVTLNGGLSDRNRGQSDE